MGPVHIPVLLKEIVEYLNCQPSGCYLDATVGGGGHAEAILKASVLGDSTPGASVPRGKLLAIDCDEAAIALSQKRLARFGKRLILVHGNFKQLKEILMQQGIDKLAGALFDLGLSSSQIENRERGFSFQLDGPLDMRQDQRQPRTAANLVNKLSQAELAEVFSRYGEERWSNRIASAIVSARQRGAMISTLQLAQIIKQAIPRAHHPRRIHPATKTFQALRIEVNRELEGLDKAIRDAVEALAVGSRICIISYHSLEDRIVKRTFSQMSGKCTCPPEFPLCVCEPRAILKPLTPKPIVPTAGEQNANPSSRSAKLRVGQRV